MLRDYLSAGNYHHDIVRNFLSGGNYCFAILRTYLSAGNYCLEMLRKYLSAGNYPLEILRNYLSGGNYRRATNAVVVLTTFFLFSRSMKRACIRDLNFIGAEITKNITQNENKAKTNAKPPTIRDFALTHPVQIQ